MTLTSECPNGWVHIRFIPVYHSDWTDEELLEYARDCVFYGTAQTSLNPEVPAPMVRTYDPFVSIEVQVSGPYNDNMDRLKACDEILVKWIRDLKAGLGLPFDRNQLFRNTAEYNPVYLQVPL